MIATAQETRRVQHVEELCAAAVRALTDDPALVYRGHCLHRHQRNLWFDAPHVRLTSDDDLAHARGAADGHALRMLHSDQDLHQQLLPADPVRRLLCESLEQFRVESLADARWPGVRANVRARHAAWSLAFHHSGLTDTPRGILISTVLQVCRARVTGDPMVADIEDDVEATRFGIVPHIGPVLATLRETRHDQRAYAAAAHEIARLVAEMLEHASEHEDARADTENEDAASALQLLLTDTSGDESLPVAAASGASRTPGAALPYRVFTTDHDCIDLASELVRPDALRTLRRQLDDLVADRRVNVQRLAQQLRTRLSGTRDRAWSNGREEGYVDAARLARLVTSSTDRRVFREPEPIERPDARVTLLVDCSGSMRQHLDHLVPVLDTLVRALDLAGIPNELLGFTTRTWNGGRARRDWNRVGRPPEPGRLNEIQHMIFKSVDETYRRSRLGIAALLRHELFREGVDGEAVEWAAGRMGDDPDQRRVLVVVSDGSPMDTATGLTNGEHYLDQHLRDVVARHEVRGDVDVRGLGVALDLTTYYARSLALDLAHEQPSLVMREITELVADP